MSDFKVIISALSFVLWGFCYMDVSASVSCNTSTTGNTLDFAYCCCRTVNISLISIKGSSLSINTSIASLARTVSTSLPSPSSTASISPSISLSASIFTSSYLVSAANSTLFTTATSVLSSIHSSSRVPSSNISTTLAISPTSVLPSVTISSSIINKVSVDTGSCFYTQVSNGVYQECLCWHTRKTQVTYNSTSSDQYRCFNVTKPKPKLYIGGFFDTDSRSHVNVLPAAEMAVADINNRSDILPKYDVVLLSNISTKGLLNYGSRVLLNYLYSGPTKIALLGPQTNDIAKTTGAISGLPRFQILQIAYGTDDPMLSQQRTVFPHFFRTKPTPELLYNEARVEILKLFRWKKVGLLYSTDSYYTKINQLLVQLLNNAKISIVGEASFGSNPTGAVESLKVQGAHVILGTFSFVHTNNVFCQAYLRDMWGPHYVWLLLGTVSFSATTECTLKQITCAARTQFFFYRNFEKTTSSNTGIGQTPEQFIQKYRLKIGNETRSDTAAKYTYDAMWAIGDILNRADKTLSPSSLLNFSYGNTYIANVIKAETLRTDFYGASNRVQFGTDGNRRMVINVYQKDLSGNGWSYKGNYDNARLIKLSIGGLIWTGGEPFKETVRKITWRYITFGLYVFYCILGALGILFALFCLIVMIWKRKTKRIYYSAVPINVIIITGCILVYISVFLFGVDGHISAINVVDNICRARMWVFCLGSALIAGGLLAKLYVAYYVLVKRILWKKRRRLLVMLTIVLIIFLVTLVLLLCWHFIDPHGRTVKYIKEQVKYLCNINVLPESPFLIKVTAVEQCTCANSLIWYPLIILWMLLLIIAGCILAYQTHDVYISSVNDTQRCGYCMYLIAVGCILGVILALATRLYPDVFFGLVGIIILIVVSAILIILYLNKILEAFTCCSGRLSSWRNSSHSESPADKLSCCRKCCGSSCPKCFACCLCCCLPILACLGKLFGCCKGCCCGSNDDTSSKAGAQKFIVNGVGDDQNAELARLKRELDMKEKYIRQMRGQTLPATYVIATQTGNPNYGNKGRSGNVKIFNQANDYSHVKSKVDCGLEKEPQNEDEAKRIKDALKEKDDEIEALKNRRYKGKGDELELQNLDAGSAVSASTILVNVCDADRNDDVDNLIKEIDDAGKNPTAGKLDDPQRQGYNSNRRGSNIKIFSQKPDWSHVRSKLKATGALTKNFGQDVSDRSEVIIVNGPNMDKEGTFKRVKSMSNIRIPTLVTPVEGPESTPVLDKRRGSAPVFNVPSPHTSPVLGMTPVYEGSESSNDEKEPKRKLSNDGRNTKGNISHGRDSEVRVVNGPGDYNSSKPKASSSPISGPNSEEKESKRKLSNDGRQAKGNPSPGLDSDVKVVNGPGGYNSNKPKTSISPVVGPQNEANSLLQDQNRGLDLLDTNQKSSRRGSNVKIFNDPKDYSHVKSKIGGSASPLLRPTNEAKRGSVQIVNKPLDVSHVKSKLF